MPRRKSCLMTVFCSAPPYGPYSGTRCWTSVRHLAQGSINVFHVEQYQPRRGPEDDGYLECPLDDIRACCRNGDNPDLWGADPERSSHHCLPRGRPPSLCRLAVSVSDGVHSGADEECIKSPKVPLHRRNSTTSKPQYTAIRSQMTCEDSCLE